MTKEKRKMVIKKFNFLLIISLISLGCSDNETLTPVDVQDDPTSELLPMPKGIISTGAKGIPIDQRIINNSFVDGFMIIQAWNEIETSEGVFNWSHIDSEVNRAKSANKIVRIAIHTGGESVPDWVTLNYPTIKEIFVYDKQTSEKRYHPAYWDATFIEVKSEFYKAIAERYKNNNNTVFAISVSMVDPNTGDWAFRIDDDEQKQSFLDAGFTETVFIEAYKQLIDNAMVNFNNKYIITAVGPVAVQLVSDKYFAVDEVLEYAFGNYGDQLVIAKGSLNANTPDPTTSNDLRTWQVIWDFRPRCAGQFVWGITNDPDFKMNGGNAYSENEKGTIFKKAFETGLKYKLNWIEPWNIDILNPDLQDELEYAQNELKK